jgi:hypothetical protein
MTKDKDGDGNEPKDNIVKFPSKPKQADNDTHYDITIESFGPEELHQRMSDLDQSYEACFHFAKAIEYTMHTYCTDLELERLQALEIKLKELFLEFSPEKG